MLKYSHSLLAIVRVNNLKVVEHRQINRIKIVLIWDQIFNIFRFKC